MQSQPIEQGYQQLPLFDTAPYTPLRGELAVDSKLQIGIDAIAERAGLRD